MERENRYFIMKYLSLVFLITATCLGQADCCIQGYVQDYYGVPMIGASVMIVGTSLGAMTDTTSHYFISEVPPGTVELVARMIGEGEERDTVIAAPGDTLEVNFILASGNQYLPDISWKYNEETYPDTVYIVIEDLHRQDINLSQVRTDEELIPSWTPSDNVIATAIPDQVDSMYLRVFPFPEVTILKPEANDTVSIALDIGTVVSNEVPSGNLIESHHLIDITEWGNPNLINWGFISSKFIYDDMGFLKLLLVYNEQAVLIDQEGQVSVVGFPFSTFHYRTDPNLKYLLIWDICGKEAVGGDAAIISLEDGSFSVFDPSPENEIHDRGYYSIGTVLASDWVTGRGKYHLSSSGTIVRLSGNDFRRYNRYGELIFTRSLEDVGLLDNHYALQFISCDQQAVSGIYNDDSLNYCFTIDIDGDLTHQSAIQFPVEQPVLRTGNIYDGNSGVVWYYHTRFGMAKTNCFNGDFIYNPDIFLSSICASRSREYLGITVYPDNENDNCSHEIRNWDTGELIYSIPEANPSMTYSRILGISDTGLCLLSRQAEDRSSERVYSIYDQDGERIFTFEYAPLSGPVNTNATISPCGTIVTIPYGRYIDIITLTSSQ